MDSLLIFPPPSFCHNFMPITSPVWVRPANQEEFAQIDYRVMRHAFDSQNEFGRLCDEIIYRNDLAARLEAAGLGPVRREVPVTAAHRDFAKTYRLDLIVADAAIYELKTEIRLAADHDAQLLNYLFLQGTHHGKLEIYQQFADSAGPKGGCRGFATLVRDRPGQPDASHHSFGSAGGLG